MTKYSLNESFVRSYSLFGLLLILNLTSYGVVPSASATVPPVAEAVMCQATLELSDLPRRFEPAPSFLQTFIVEGIAAVNPQLEQEGITLAKAATFIDFERAEIAMGLTATLPNRRVIDRFDEVLESPDTQALFVLGLQQSLANLGMVKVNKVRAIAELRGIGELARGFAIDAEFEELPLKLWTSAILFRRGGNAALVILGSLEGELEEFSIKNLAAKLDRRLRQCGHSKEQALFLVDWIVR